jgi:hypothetical protein
VELKQPIHPWLVLKTVYRKSLAIVFNMVSGVILYQNFNIDITG